MTVEAIKDAIVHLSEPERNELANWFGELEEEQGFTYRKSKKERDAQPQERVTSRGRSF